MRHTTCVLHVWLPLLPLWLTACSSAPMTSATLREYEREGIAFSIPDNWKVSEDSIEGGGRVIFVEAPPGTSATILQFDQTQFESLAEFAQVMSNKRTEGIGAAKGSQTNSNFTGHVTTLDGREYRGLAETFDLQLDAAVPSTAYYYSFTLDGKTTFLIFQTPSEDLQHVQSGFDAILKTIELGGKRPPVDDRPAGA